MLTPIMGVGPVPLGVGHHTGRKIYKLPGEQILGWAGDLGLAMRFKTLVESNPASAGMPLPPGALPAAPRPPFPTPLDYGLLLTLFINNQFAATRVPNHDGAASFIGFVHGGAPQCCAFTGGMQPFVMDHDHYYMALGTGKLSADPFLKFLVDIFCKARRPTVREALFFATWTVQHAIETTQGGVAAPIRVGVIETVNGVLQARELPDTEIDEHLQAKASAEQAMRDWRDRIQSGEAAEGIEPVPVPAEPAQPGLPTEAAPAAIPGTEPAQQ